MTNEHVCRYLELCPDGSYFCGGCQKTYRLTLETLREQEAKAIQALEHIRDYCNGTEANGIARSALVDIAEMNAHEPLPVDPLASVDCWLESYCGLVHPQAQKALRDIIDAGASRDASSPGACAVDPRDAVIAELTKWADDWAVYRGPAEKPVDKGWRLAAEELQSILKKSATRTFEQLQEKP